MMKNLFIILGSVTAVSIIGFLIVNRIPSIDIRNTDFLNRTVTFIVFGKTYTYKVGQSPFDVTNPKRDYSVQISEVFEGNKVRLIFTIYKSGMLVKNIPLKELI